MATQISPKTTVGDTSTSNPFRLATGGYDWDAISKVIGEAQTRTRNVLMPKLPTDAELYRQLSRTQLVEPGKPAVSPGALRPGGGTLRFEGRRYEGRPGAQPGRTTADPALMERAQEARENVQLQGKQMQQEAANRADALAMQAETTRQAIEGADAAMQDLTARGGEASKIWETAVAQADEYVGAANKRMAEAMGRLDTAISGVYEGLDTARAHAVSSQVAGTISEMNSTERDILQMYGRNSPEHQQFLGMKSRSLHVAVSNIQNSFAQLRANIGVTLAQTGADLGSAMSQLVNYQEKLHVETLAAYAQWDQQWELSKAAYQLQVEEFKALQMNNLVEGIQGMPILRLDTMPLMEYIADLAFENEVPEEMTNAPTGFRAPTTTR